MSLLQRFFGAKKGHARRETSSEAPGPARFLPEDFSVKLFEDLSGNEAARKVVDGEVLVLDVRYEYEYHDHRIPDATLIPLPQLYARFHELDPQKPTLVVCEHGLRSLNACSFLGNQGFKKLYNLAGGMSAYPGPQEGVGT
jgi:rhodanese-related sulfurtransferase